MNVEFMVVCDYATVTPDQKITMVGTFDRIHTNQVPIQLPAMGIGARFRDARPPNGKAHHEFEIRIKGPDGTRIAGIAGQVDAEVRDGAQAEGGLVLPVGVMIGGLVFPKFGAYQVELWIDKQHAHSLPLWVSRLPAGAKNPDAPVTPMNPPARIPGPAPYRVVLPPRKGSQ